MPQYWSSPLNRAQRVFFVRADEKFRELELLVNRSVADEHREVRGYESLRLTRVARIQNPSQWLHYYLRREELIEKVSEGVHPIEGSLCPSLDNRCNEYLLFHGLNAGVLETIAESGFDERVSSLEGMFGCGVYFAENASKSDLYCHTAACAQVGALYQGKRSKCTCWKDMDVERSMLVARVTMGNPWVRYESTDKVNPLRRAPEPYDSVLGESKAHSRRAKLKYREMIVYDRRQCYAEYILWYKRSPTPYPFSASSPTAAKRRTAKK